MNVYKSIQVSHLEKVDLVDDDDRSKVFPSQIVKHILATDTKWLMPLLIDAIFENASP